MKTLHLLRHAKSAWDEADLSDRERGLNKRGRRDAPRMGAALSGLIEPLSIAASPARRAQLTLAGLMDGWPALAEIEHDTEEDLYTFSASDVADWLMAVDDGEDACFIIGHNPALTELINALTGEYALANLPTAGYARLALDIDRWTALGQGVGRLEYSLFPKQLS